MEKLFIDEIAEAVNGEIYGCYKELYVTCVCTDTRKIENGCLFVPIIGQNFDAHDFINEAFENGAIVSLTQKNVDPSILTKKKGIYIKVKDTTLALGQLAAYYRSKFDIPIIAVTGSVGKTTTKEMIAKAIASKYRVLKTKGNFNNHIGLPLTIFEINKETEAAVVEMGMSDFGEISYLSKIAKPDIAVITNIGISHIANLGSKQNILKAKLEILDGLNTDGLIILNGDDSLLNSVKGLLNIETKLYGMDENLDLQAYNVKSLGQEGILFNFTYFNYEYEVFIPVPGSHNIYNALASILIGIRLNVPIELIIKGIENYTQEKMRLNIINGNGIKIINDTYNASPDSMKAAIDVLQDVAAGNRRIAVLGDMLELGEWSDNAHFEIGQYLLKHNIEIIITVGDLSKQIALGARESLQNRNKIFSFDSNKEASDFLKSSVEIGDVILVKGSRGMKMEQIVEELLSIY